MQEKREAERISGTSNVAYDLVTILQNKLQGIAAMEEYKRDAEQANDREVLDLLNDLERREVEDVNRLEGLVAQRLR